VIISPSKKFVYIKNHRVAGTSVEVWLSQVCKSNAVITKGSEEAEKLIREGENYERPKNIHVSVLSSWRNFTLQDWVRLITKGRGPTMFEHERISKIRKYYPYADENYFSFCIERNPWAKAVSLYGYWLETGRIEEENYTFRKFIQNCPHSISDWERYANSAGEVLVDYVCRFEELNKELEHICNVIGIKKERLGDLPKIKGTSGTVFTSRYKKYYDQKTKNIVKKYCKREVEHFGYEF